MSTPDWLTKNYVEEALRVFYKDVTLKILTFDITPALGKGENFGGVLTRIKTKFQYGKPIITECKSLIVKTEHSDDFSKKTMEPYDIFNREMSIYEKVLPHLQQLLRNIGDEDRLFPLAVHVDYQRQVIIFEDLCEQGYIMADRREGLNRQHIILILRKIAKMHATSAVFNETHNNCLEHYDRGFFNRYTDNYKPYFVGSLLACADCVSEWPDYKYYSDKLYALESAYMEIGKRCFAPTPGHVNVFCHGDLWTNNVMFKYDEKTGEPIDVLLIDFQYSFWGSPTLDLHHFFNTSLNEEIRLHKLDELYRFYHEIFIDNLKKLKYQSHPLPSLKLFRLHVEQKRFFAFHSSCIIQPVMINENCEDADFVALMAEDERALKFKRDVYRNKKVHKNLINLLPLFDRRGLLDVNQS